MSTARLPDLHTCVFGGTDVGKTSFIGGTGLAGYGEDVAQDYYSAKLRLVDYSRETVKNESPWSRMTILP